MPSSAYSNTRMPARTQLCRSGWMFGESDSAATCPSSTSAVAARKPSPTARIAGKRAAATRST
jgi:hypothetical protein